MKSVLRTGFILLMVFGRGPVVASPITDFPELDYEVPSKQSETSKKTFQRSLSGLYSIDSWKQAALQQPYSDFESMYHAAPAAQHELANLINEISLVTETASVVPPVKSKERAEVKINTELNGQVDKITDLARASIVADDIPSLVQAFELMNKEVEIVAIKNRFKSPTESGYRDLKMLVQLPKSKMIAEVQLHLSAISTVKNGEEHEIYEQVQHIERNALAEKRDITEFEKAQIAKLRATSKNLYHDAWQQYLQPVSIAS
ncbi:RelA/SpoT domain-containing protein [Photobacterium sanctipauli]|uniref:RelA/SpoT domain-containing protein n=1 Tax=Photobacterium sanctipauli TaxID=1342794 RepID=UPI00156967EB|nr:RelA/SpoT domain-containing protein [Photobacterium sanctipauli]